MTFQEKNIYTMPNIWVIMQFFHFVSLSALKKLQSKKQNHLVLVFKQIYNLLLID